MLAVLFYIDDLIITGTDVDCFIQQLITKLAFRFFFNVVEKKEREENLWYNQDGGNGGKENNNPCKYNKL